MKKEEIENSKQFVECKKAAISKIRKCFHPNCSGNSINSHILQKNGILSTIAKDNHLWEIRVNPFKSPSFHPKRTGINEVFSFNCFCNEHDTNLFSKIEKEEINFEDYQSCLLFTVRTFYNELFRKMVGIDQFTCLIDKSDDEFAKSQFRKTIDSTKLAVQDLDFIKNLIWSDIDKGSESFVFKYRILEKVELILSSFYDFETSNEIKKYQMENGGRDLDRLSSIFITLFPYKGKSVLLMGYTKEDESKVKGYFNSFFKETEKRVQRKITNLMLFQCENWVCSENFYKKKIKGKENLFANTAYFSSRNYNERRVFDLNIFNEGFDKKLETWNSEHGRK